MFTNYNRLSCLRISSGPNGSDSPAAYNIYKNSDDGQYQQYMDQTTCRVNEKAQNPSDNENNCD